MLHEAAVPVHRHKLLDVYVEERAAHILADACILIPAALGLLGTLALAALSAVHTPHLRVTVAVTAADATATPRGSAASFGAFFAASPAGRHPAEDWGDGKALHR